MSLAGCVDVQLRLWIRGANTDITGPLIDKKPGLPISITDVHPRNASTPRIVGVALRVERELPGGGRVLKVPIDVEERLVAGVVSYGLETERIIGELDQTVLFLIEHAVN